MGLPEVLLFYWGSTPVLVCGGRLMAGKKPDCHTAVLVGMEPVKTVC